MAAGACDRCGNAHEECTCALVNRVAVQLMPFADTLRLPHETGPHATPRALAAQLLTATGTHPPISADTVQAWLRSRGLAEPPAYLVTSIGLAVLRGQPARGTCDLCENLWERCECAERASAAFWLERLRQNPGHAEQCLVGREAYLTLRGGERELFKRAIFARTYTESGEELRALIKSGVL